jgi:glycosyltransferase involved in cell wall biosynthesis
MPALPLVSFVIPLYNTGDAIVKLFDAFRLLPIPEGYELVLVNDGSRDKTFERAAELAKTMPIPVTLVDFARNFGEHAAVMEGLRRSRGEFVVNLDDDLQNPVSEAIKLLNHLRQSSDEVLYSYYEEKKHHWFRNIGSWATSTIATFLLDKPRDLYLCSFRAMRRELVERVILYTGPYPYIDGLILGATNRIGRLQVLHEERADGQSGYTLRRLLRLWANMFFNFSIMPLRVASLLGVILCVLGAIILISVLIEHFIYGVEQSGWASLMSAISIFSGSQLFILGLLGEYVGRAYMTLAGKPQSLVRTVMEHEMHTPLIAGGRKQS